MHGAQRYGSLTMYRKFITTINRASTSCLALCLISLQAQAGAFSVTTTSGDTSAGSLGASFTGSSGSGAATSDTVSFGGLFATPQTITLTGSYPAVAKNAGTSVTFANPGSILTVDGGGNTILDLSGGGAFTLHNNIKLQNGSVLIGNATVLNAGLNAANITLTGGTLHASNAFTSSGTMTLAGAGGTLSTGLYTLTLSGSIGGSGGLTVTSDGTYLGGAFAMTGPGNTYTGGTTVNSTTLAIYDDNGLGNASGGLTLSSGTLTAGTSLTLGAARTITLAGTFSKFFTGTGNTLTVNSNIVGTGGLDLTGGGTFVLSGVGTYTGGTALTSTLQISNDAALGNAAGTLFLAGGVVTSTVNLSISRAITVQAGGGSIQVGSGLTTTLAGVVDGTGVLTKLGAGSLALSNTNTFASLAVNAGTARLGAAGGAGSGPLSVSGGATFDLNGFNPTVGAVTNAGQITTGASKLSAASYSGAGTLSVVLQAATPNLQTTGNANVTGGTLSLSAKPTTGSYTVISAGTLTGTFASISAPAGVTITPIYGATSLMLDILASTTYGLTGGLSGNQSAIARAIDFASQHSTADLDSVTAQLDGLSGASLTRTLDQMGPAMLGALGGMSFSGSGVQSGAVGQRLVGLRSGGVNGARSAYFTVNREQPYPGVLIAAAPGDTEAYPRGRDTTSPWGSFVAGLGGFGRLDGRTDANGSTPGYSFSSGGGVAGVDYRLREGLIAGLSAGYTNNSAMIDAGGGSVRGQSLRYGAYGTAYGEQSHATLFLGGASDSYDSTRNIVALARTATSKPRAQELNVDASGGFDRRIGSVLVSPFVGLAYDRVAAGAFAESGAGAVNLTVSPFTAESLRSTLGAQISREVKVDGRRLSPYASASWRHEFKSQSRAIDAQFSTGGSFTVHTADVARDGASLGAGIRAELGRGWSSELGYTGDFRPGFRAHTLNGDLRLKF